MEGRFKISYVLILKLIEWLFLRINKNIKDIFTYNQTINLLIL